LAPGHGAIERLEELVPGNGGHAFIVAIRGDATRYKQRKYCSEKPEQVGAT
jgi:hypothetical protein